MKLSEFKEHLNVLENLNFVQVNGELVPAHFHITEVGLVTKHYVDCGGDVHKEKSANIQIWVADDTEHRLQPKALLHIIAISDKVLGEEDLEIEVEYQTETIGKYTLRFEFEHFVLGATETDCLAKSKCGIPQPKQLVNLVAESTSCCTPGGGCC